jgi:exopolysaccharide production protein ExoQ
MTPAIALIICVVFVVWLLFIENKGKLKASSAVWVPTIFLLISGTRPVGRWFETDLNSLDVVGEAGSPIDRMVLSILIVLALLIISRRRIGWSVVLKGNFWLIALYLYLGSSILWSNYPEVSAKRWIRLLGVIPIAMVILSERSPFEAFESVLKRCAYLLIPFSLLTVKYFPEIGVQFNRWSGERMWTGVATQKNGLGQLCAISLIFLIWSYVRNWRSGKLFNDKYEVFADAMVLGISAFLICGPGGSFSATSIGILIACLSLMLILYRKTNITIWISYHLRVLLFFFTLIFISTYDILVRNISAIFGRDATLTGRDDIWRIVLDVASRNPLIGVGYGGFWGLEIKEAMATGVVQAHNGYIDVYLQAGIVGIVILSLFLFSFCYSVRRMIDLNFEWGVLKICFLLFFLLLNITETAVLNTGFIWSIMIFFSFLNSRKINIANKW